MRRKNTCFTMPLEIEAVGRGRNNQTVEYEVVCEVTPFVPGKLSGPPENCYPDEGNDVEVKEVWLVTKGVTCPEEPKLTYWSKQEGAKHAVTCRTCHGLGTYTRRERRKELDELVDDEIVVEAADGYREED